ncbi:hypothetical protein DLAC_11645 [Tieghemostelium lacteum]|uniref:Uncharacterized protein n=1 Tax=Tieghemostelium lacteum TaxID=361077 RepID=A0A151ZHT0_TIELA|nr:hypothetical protein DLAC_11645 [Tieghemostelium lacteum]|eukprot:KYQ93430.1 hypothetical protein DLAC_11645 [Tieghemostelium lacteum]
MDIENLTLENYLNDVNVEIFNQAQNVEQPNSEYMDNQEEMMKRLNEILESDSVVKKAEKELLFKFQQEQDANPNCIKEN